MTKRHENEARNAASLVYYLFGVEAEVYDTEGRQGVPDIKLLFQDGRVGMLELTRYDDEDEIELESLLNIYESHFDSTGCFVWSIEVSKTTNLKRLEEVYAYVIALCEQFGVESVDCLPDAIKDEDPDVVWFLDSGARLTRHDALLKTEDDGLPRPTYIRQQPIALFTTDNWSELNAGLATLFKDETIQKHCDKLLRSDADFHCLMIRCGMSKLPEKLAELLNFHHDTPPPVEPPPLPSGVDSLILVPEWQGQVLVWCENQWSTYPLPDLFRKITPLD